MRISVRLDPEHAEKLQRLARRTGQTTSEIVKRAIDVYHERAEPAERPYDVLMRAADRVRCWGHCGRLRAGLTWKADVGEDIDTLRQSTSATTSSTRGLADAAIPAPERYEEGCRQEQYGKCQQAARNRAREEGNRRSEQDHTLDERTLRDRPEENAKYHRYH